ncbi:MAG: hypothetical protein KDD53_11980 [Bdellovibrionales bacterium]|nr:hypothetical protein [Bdellovibrionales bacterium]
MIESTHVRRQRQLYTGHCPVAYEFNNPLLSCLAIMLRPLVRFCLKRSLGLQDLLDTAKVVFVNVAAEEIVRHNKRVNISKISALTGVHRKDVAKIYREGSLPETIDRVPARVISQWREDSRFTNNSGKPRILGFRGDNNEFAELVSVVSTDLKPGAVLFDLERAGAVERTKGGLKLIAKAYQPRGDIRESFELLAVDAEELIEAVQANIFSESEELPNFHGKFVYDNVSQVDVSKLRKWLFRQCSQFHLRVAKHVAKYDLDLNPCKGKQGGGRIVIGLFTRTDEKFD